jgi:hypothetical protein
MQRLFCGFSIYFSALSLWIDFIYTYLNCRLHQFLIHLCQQPNEEYIKIENGRRQLFGEIRFKFLALRSAVYDVVLFCVSRLSISYYHLRFSLVYIYFSALSLWIDFIYTYLNCRLHQFLIHLCQQPNEEYIKTPGAK